MLIAHGLYGDAGQQQPHQHGSQGHVGDDPFLLLTASQTSLHPETKFKSCPGQIYRLIVT